MPTAELRTCAVSGMLLRLYAVKRLRPRLLALAGRLEGGHNFSATMRRIMSSHHDVEVGAYSYGSCFEPGAFPGGAAIGRYVSLASGVRRRLNHPFQNLSMHPFFYNEKFGYVPSRTIAHAAIDIGHDAWVGESVIFTEECRRVGIGAVIGAGSVVTRDVGDFDVVAGVPARFIRKRFDDDVRARILESRWWELPVAELARFAKDLNMPIAGWPHDHPLLRAPRAGAGRAP
jgi:virginiamycin A acetyltransferase